MLPLAHLVHCLGHLWFPFPGDSILSKVRKAAFSCPHVFLANRYHKRGCLQGTNLTYLHTNVNPQKIKQVGVAAQLAMPAAWAHNAAAALTAMGADLAPSLDALSILREGPHAAFDASALRRLVDDATSADQDLQAACCCCIVSWSAVLVEFNHACGKGSL